MLLFTTAHINNNGAHLLSSVSPSCFRGVSPSCWCFLLCFFFFLFFYSISLCSFMLICFIFFFLLWDWIRSRVIKLLLMGCNVFRLNYEEITCRISVTMNEKMNLKLLGKPRLRYILHGKLIIYSTFKEKYVHKLKNLI